MSRSKIRKTEGGAIVVFEKARVEEDTDGDVEETGVVEETSAKGKRVSHHENLIIARSKLRSKRIKAEDALRVRHAQLKTLREKYQHFSSRLKTSEASYKQARADFIEVKATYDEAKEVFEMDSRQHDEAVRVGNEADAHRAREEAELANIDRQLGELDNILGKVTYVESESQVAPAPRVASLAIAPSSSPTSSSRPSWLEDRENPHPAWVSGMASVSLDE